MSKLKALTYFNSILTKLNKRPPSNFLQKGSNYATIIGSLITLFLGIITLWLMIKYGENQEMIEKLVSISSKLERQNEMTREQINQLSSQTQIALEQGKLLKTQLSLAEIQLKNALVKDSIEKWAHVIRFSNNYDELLMIGCLIHDTTATRSWDNDKKYNILMELSQNLNEGLLNPVLIEDKISFNEWNSLAGQVGGMLSTWPRQSQTLNYVMIGMTKEEVEKFNDDVFIDIIKNCISVTNKLFKRIICKYKYNAACD